MGIGEFSDRHPTNTFEGKMAAALRVLLVLFSIMIMIRIV
jgi:hypothetical protein